MPNTAVYGFTFLEYIANNVNFNMVVGCSMLFSSYTRFHNYFVLYRWGAGTGSLDLAS